MPGRNPSEAVDEFLAPLQRALSCIANGKISVKRGGRSPAVGAPQQWSLNNAGGAVLRSTGSGGGELELFASMWWHVITDDRDGYGPYRVTTTGYDYSLVQRATDDELWALHWHPEVASDERKPHLHLGNILLADNAPVSAASHLPTGRMTFETAVRWAIEFGAEPLIAEWEDRLLLAETPHLLYRSWSVDPELAHGT